MIFQFCAVLILFAHAESAYVRGILTNKDEKLPTILETQLVRGDFDAESGSGHHFKLIAPVTLSSQYFTHQVEFPASHVQVCEGDRTKIILSTSDCQETTASDALHVEFSHVDSWQNSARIELPAFGHDPVLIQHFDKVYCFWSKY